MINRAQVDLPQADISGSDKGWLKLLPLAVFYVAVVLVLSNDTLRNDEVAYTTLATCLAQGHYNPAPPEIPLWRGPGYPLLLVPFVALRLPYHVPKLLNIGFLFGAVIFFYATLRLFLAEKPARWATYAFGLYPPMLAESNRLMTEPFATFLLAGFAFFVCSLCLSGPLAPTRRRALLYVVLAAAFLAYLAVTKVFFGYVILAALPLTGLWYLWQRDPRLPRVIGIYTLALALCTPWLFYTYKQTGKIFYWSTSGGMQLYWMSTPYAGEYGDWISPDLVFANDALRQNHGALFKRLQGMTGVQMDEELKRLAVQNILHHPAKYALNWVANVSRLLFSYPYTLQNENLRTLPRMIPNMILITLALLALYPAWLARRRVPLGIYLALSFGLIALGGSSLLSAYERQFHILVPLFGLWLAFVLSRAVRVKVIAEPIATAQDT